MPNHTTNLLEITGEPSDVKAFMDTVNKGEGNGIEFETIVPMPEVLKNTSSPCKIMTQEEIDEMWDNFNKLDQKEKDKFNGRPFGIGITQETHDECMRKYGYADWYSWAVENWGTKWAAYDDMGWDYLEDDNYASIFFNTAWAPPSAFFIQASKKFPNLEFELSFADEGGGFLGVQIIKNGEVVDDKDLEWNSDEGKELRETLGVYFPEDEDEED